MSTFYSFYAIFYQIIAALVCIRDLFLNIKILQTPKLFLTIISYISIDLENTC